MKTAQNRFKVQSIMLREAARSLRKELANRPSVTAHNAIGAVDAVAEELETLATQDDAVLKAAHALADAVLDHLALNSRRRILAQQFRNVAAPEGDVSLKGVGHP